MRLRRIGPRVRSAVVLAAATTLANAFGYLLVLVLARSLPASEFGAAGALLNLVVIGLVPPLALQLVVARAVAAGAEQTAGAEHSVGVDEAATLRRAAVRAGIEVGIGSAAVVGLASPFLGRFLHLDGPGAALAVGAFFVPAAVGYAVQGLLQGSRRFVALALVMVGTAAVRPLAGLANRLIGPGVTALAVLLGVGTALVAGASLLLFERGSKASADVVRRTVAGWRPEIVSAALATAGLLTFANIDVLLARHVLEGSASGAYTVGAVFAKVAFWGPQFVSTLLFPRLAQHGRRASAVAGAVVVQGVAGSVAVVVTRILGTPLVVLVGGGGYRFLGSQVWLFAAFGAVLAVAQGLLYGRVAVGGRRLGLVAWLCVVGLVVAVLADPSPTVSGVVGRALAAALVFVAAGLVAERSALASVVRTARPSRTRPSRARATRR